MIYQYRAADGVWRARCWDHIPRSGLRRTITQPEPAQATICVACLYQQPLGVLGQQPATHNPQPITHNRSKP